MAQAGKLVEAKTPKSIDQSRRNEITAGLKRLTDKELNFSAEEWRQLEAILHAFHQSYSDWQGYLSNGEMTKVSGIGSKAEKLSSAIEGAEKSGLGKILDYELAPITSDQLLAALDRLAKIDVRSPRTSDGEKLGGMSVQNRLKADLQSTLDAWWKRNTRSSPKIEESLVTPFSYFLAQIFKILPYEISSSLGHSRTAVSERRRAVKRLEAIRLEAVERRAAQTETFRKLAEKNAGKAT